MCGRYRRTSSEEELCRIYNIPIPPQLDLPVSYNIVPSQTVLAIRFNLKTGQRSLDALQCGLIPHWAKDPKIAYKTINARVETVDTAPSYRQVFKKRLCLTRKNLYQGTRRTRHPLLNTPSHVPHIKSDACLGRLVTVELRNLAAAAHFQEGHENGLGAPRRSMSTPSHVYPPHIRALSLPWICGLIDAKDKREKRRFE
jgi:SOS response associated peptidase (SRAP)